MAADPFAGIIGHEMACSVLRRGFESGRLPHAILIVGSEGIGRRTLAEALIEKFLDAATPTTPNPSSGRRGDLVSNPDFIRLTIETDPKTGKEKSLISVEQVRDLREQMSLSSFSGRKAALIEDAGRLGSSAQTLLKTLEEPPGNSLIVLRAPSVESVPATIASRCQTIRLHTVSRDQIVKALTSRGIAADEATSLARLSMGAPGKALRLLRDGAERAKQEIGLSSFLACFDGQIPERLKAAAGLLPKEEGNKALVFSQTLDGWEQAARDVLLDGLACEKLATRDDPRLQTLSKRLTPSKLLKILQTLSQARRDAVQHVNPLLALEHVILSA